MCMVITFKKISASKNVDEKNIMSILCGFRCVFPLRMIIRLGTDLF